MTTTKPPLGKVNIYDWLKGLLLTIFPAFIASLSITLGAGSLPTLAQVKIIGLTSLLAGAGYMLKQWGTNSDGKLLTKETTTDNPQ